MWTGVSPKRIATRKMSFIKLFLNNSTVNNPLLDFLRKEVIQPHLPIRLPCYDFTPVIEPAFGSSLPLLSMISFADRDLYPFRDVFYYRIQQNSVLLSRGSCSLGVGSLTSGISNSHGVTGDVYKTRERIHRDILIRDY